MFISALTFRLQSISLTNNIIIIGTLFHVCYRCVCLVNMQRWNNNNNNINNNIGHKNLAWRISIIHRVDEPNARILYVTTRSMIVKIACEIDANCKELHSYEISHDNWCFTLTLTESPWVTSYTRHILNTNSSDVQIRRLVNFF